MNSNCNMSVDDLISSFSSSHIGQEAMDLAALQAQLSATLSSFNHCAAQVPLVQWGRGRATARTNTRPCNTPRALTPTPSGSMSSSFSFASAGADMGGRTRNNSESALQNNDDDMYMEEDERMVEELLLLPSSSSQSPSSMSTTASYSTPSSPSPSQPSSSFFSESPSSPSLFATTDPFYLAQLQLEQQQQAQQQQQQMMLQSQSVFAQNGRLAPTSPFAMPMGQFGHQFYSHPQQNFATAF